MDDRPPRAYAAPPACEPSAHAVSLEMPVAVAGRPFADRVAGSSPAGDAARIAVVVPSYRVSRSVVDVVRRIGPECAFIYVVDGNFENRGELLMHQRHEGVDLKLDHGRDTLANLNRVWKRPVNLTTKIDGKGKLLRYDGRDHSEKGVEYVDK